MRLLLWRKDRHAKIAQDPTEGMAQVIGKAVHVDYTGQKEFHPTLKIEIKGLTESDLRKLRQAGYRLRRLPEAKASRRTPASR